MKNLETHRLWLRPFEDADLFDFHTYARDGEVGPSAGWPPHETLAQTREVLLRFITGDNVWAIVDKDSGKVIGSVGLHKDQKRDSSDKMRMIGYALGKAWWGRGYMTEAVERVLQYLFLEEGLELVSVCHYPENMRSKRVIEKCGFVYEGTLRKASLLYDGRLLDDVCYSITREEYLHRNGRGQGNPV